ncbi:Sel1 repeat protein [Formosa agariphila KMM 3901]|uniref:Sel1 repeat protein n=1 Tax=Formosa agariphila (strain DSM 15362 / KCTC 12365 / LMG 23005 / KMM 3901 / M-2Alg 35-1) TaxID=1347342 RepID=T2KQY8_FORAG|nr:tetratricopeptide repeat protein [Formosa agariphila]CDF81252.1 Sel1 repeat protein [Formosa agariphila KMM 3901]
MKNIQLTFRALIIAGFFSVISCKDNASSKIKTTENSTHTTEVKDQNPESTQTENTSTDETQSPDGVAFFDAGIRAIEANNMSAAFKEFLAAANEGHALAQFNTGLMYEQGLGTDKNPEEAFLWYNKSANQGNSAAQFNLGVSYENGLGTTIDYTKANEWYRKASLQGDGLAVGNLGMLYMRGQGVEVNQVAGVALLIVSATIDTSPENQARKNISASRSLTPEMIAKAQTLSNEMSTAENILIPLDAYLNN